MNGVVRRAEVDARLKQDMLARGLSVEEIKDLSSSPSPFIRPVEGIQKLFSEAEKQERGRHEANILAGVLVAMVQAGGWKPDVVAELLAGIPG